MIHWSKRRDHLRFLFVFSQRNTRQIHNKNNAQSPYTVHPPEQGTSPLRNKGWLLSALGKAIWWPFRTYAKRCAWLKDETGVRWSWQLGKWSQRSQFSNEKMAAFDPFFIVFISFPLWFGKNYYLILFGIIFLPVSFHSRLCQQNDRVPDIALSFFSKKMTFDHSLFLMGELGLLLSNVKKMPKNEKKNNPRFLRPFFFLDFFLGNELYKKTNWLHEGPVFHFWFFIRPADGRRAFELLDWHRTTGRCFWVCFGGWFRCFGRCVTRHT